jgi:hypothetical protein
MKAKTILDTEKKDAIPIASLNRHGSIKNDI